MPKTTGDAADVRDAYEEAYAKAIAADAADAAATRKKREAAAGDVGESVADDHRLELVANPMDSARILWLQAGRKWVHWDNPSDAILAPVQAAFSNHALEVVVRYRSEMIVKLVVRPKQESSGSGPSP
jgi:hypothetical protein